MSKLIVVGASWGGVQALQSLVRRLPADLDAAVLIVLHIGASPSRLPALLGRPDGMPVSHAVHGQKIVPSRVYVAPPDHHMMVVDGVILLSRGPKEHHTRPAIDPLFRSAALARGASVVGVVLTGMMDDGTEGLQAIKACGGTAVVQAPADAFCPEMPLGAMRHVAVDHCVPIAEMPALLTALAAKENEPMPTPTPERLVHEQALATGSGDPLKHLLPIATPSTFTCPDCQGSLWRITASKPERFICNPGHAFSLRTLTHAAAEKTDEAVWNAMRALQENSLLLRHGAEHERDSGHAEEAGRLEARAVGLQQQADLLRAMVQGERGDMPAEADARE